METESSLTEQLQVFLQGNRTEAEDLLRQILPKLHEIAVREVNKERYAPISATELIQEIWLRNISKQNGRSAIAVIFTRLRVWR